MRAKNGQGGCGAVVGGGHGGTHMHFDAEGVR